MDILRILNSDLAIPVLALVVLIVYLVTRIRNNRKYKR